MFKSKDWFKDVWSPSNLWTAFVWLCPTASATVSAGLSYLWGLPPSVTLMVALMTAACAVIVYDFTRKWFDRRNVYLLKIAELEKRLLPPVSDIELVLDGQVWESLTDVNDNRLPSSLSFAARVTNRGDRFLTNCQITFGAERAVYTVSACFDLRRGEHKVFPFLRTKDLPLDHRDNRATLVYFLTSDWKIMADGPAWLVPPGIYTLKVLSADTGPATLDVRLTKGSSWQLEECPRDKI